MKTSLLLLLILLAPAGRVPAPAQTPAGAGAGSFSKGGLSFDYPAGWSLEDKSGADVQHLILTRPNSSALIMIVAHREPLQNLGQFAAARHAITQPYLESIAGQLGATAPETPDPQCLAVGDSLAAGYRIAGRIKGEPSTAEVYPLLKGQRLLHLVFVRHDKDEAGGAAAWKSVVETLKVEPPAGASPEAGQMARVVSGGVLNGRALKKPAPQYPSAAHAARAQGTVTVQIVVDESGKVISAAAVSGHPTLRGAGEEAARRAKFSPTTLCGKPVKVTGVITYNFVLL
ncbi:MAG TPA: TonB family protein [Pyrinomonadaceae bacterium]|jgi:TonB family protein